MGLALPHGLVQGMWWLGTRRGATGESQRHGRRPESTCLLRAAPPTNLANIVCARLQVAVTTDRSHKKQSKPIWVPWSRVSGTAVAGT